MNLYESLNPQQCEAVQHFEGPLLILAGAGSGKTRVLTHRIARLIEEEGVNPRNILAITFTNKAAGEMRDRVERMLGNVGGVWVSTFHSTCVRILRRYIDLIGHSTNFTIYDGDDQKTVIKDVCKRLEVDTKIFKERLFLGAISSAKDELVGPEEYARRAQGDYRMEKISQVYREYQAQLKSNNALDFDDLICKTVELFEKVPEVLDSYQERFRFILVDEYQDTNHAQFKLVSLLASKYRNLCVVGDDDQSIYKFRGANIGNILNFEKDFPDAKVIRLEQNYRSTQSILDAANEVIKHNEGRKRKTLWTANPDGERVKFRQFMNGFEEAEYVAEKIAGTVRKGEWSYGDCAVLYRTNAQSRLFEEKFLLANIPYKIVGGVNFYARKEIKDILAYLKTIANAEDDLAVRRIINVPKRGIGQASVSRVQEYAIAHGTSFYEMLRDADKIPGVGRTGLKMRSFVEMIQAFRSKAEYFTIKELIEDVLEVTGYVKELEAEGTEEADERIANIDELLNKAAAFDEEFGGEEEPDGDRVPEENEKSGASGFDRIFDEDREFRGGGESGAGRENRQSLLDMFLEEVALVADIDDLEETPDRVVLMTLHSAKGLEFSVVFLVGMEDGLFPSYLSISSDDPTEIEEERRLCYVGITRAKRELTLTCARQRMVRGETHYSKVSRFVEDIPDEMLLKHEPLPEPQRPAKARQQSAYQQAREAFRAKVFVPQQFQVKKAETLDYGVGDRVRHVKFGDGVVKAIVEGGRDYEVTVEFDRVGQKKMFASFAKLEKV